MKLFVSVTDSSQFHLFIFLKVNVVFLSYKCKFHYSRGIIPSEIKQRNRIDCILAMKIDYICMQKRWSSHGGQASQVVVQYHSINLSSYLPANLLASVSTYHSIPCQHCVIRLQAISSLASQYILHSLYSLFSLGLRHKDLYTSSFSAAGNILEMYPFKQANNLFTLIKPILGLE